MALNGVAMRAADAKIPAFCTGFLGGANGMGPGPQNRVKLFLFRGFKGCGAALQGCLRKSPSVFDVFWFLNSGASGEREISSGNLPL